MVVPDSILIKNGVILDSQGSRKADLLVRAGIIAQIARGITPEGILNSDNQENGIPAPDSDLKVVNAHGCIITPALADVHVHFREPGNPEKETIRTGSMAAAAGGFTAVCTMPNLNPAPDSPENIAIEQKLIDEGACIDVLPYATITKGRKGLEPVDVQALKDLAVAFSDDGSGVQDEAAMEEAMRLIAANDCILAAHCEDNSLLNGGYIHQGSYAGIHGHKGICSRSEWGQIERDLKLAAKTGCRYHVCHISTKESVELIRRAKKRGVKVTCETAPHYLDLIDRDIEEDGRFKMNPPIRGEQDRLALIQGIKDGTIDIIATDHAPHTAEQKSKGLQESAFGVVGLETAFPVLYTRLVGRGIISAQKLIELMSDNPRRLFGLHSAVLEEGQTAELAVFDTANRYFVNPDEFLSKGHATPFDGWAVRGRCALTMHDGRIVYARDEYLRQ